MLARIIFAVNTRFTGKLRTDAFKPGGSIYRTIFVAQERRKNCAAAKAESYSVKYPVF